MIGKIRKLKGKPQILHFQEFGKGEPLILLHGIIVNSNMYKRLVKYLEPYYRCIIPDLRGHGKSRHHNKYLSFSLQAKDIALLLDDLEIPKAHVLGYSMGGVLAQQFALDFPERVHSLILACTFSHKGLTTVEKVQNKFFMEYLQLTGPKGLRRIVNPFIAGGTPLSQKTVHWYKQLIHRMDKETLLKLFRNLFAFDSRRKLGEIKMPTLVIGAKDDLMVPIHHSEFLHKNIPNSEFKVMPDGHNVVYTHAEELAEVIREFLERYPLAADKIYSAKT